VHVSGKWILPVEAVLCLTHSISGEGLGDSGSAEYFVFYREWKEQHKTVTGNPGFAVHPVVVTQVYSSVNCDQFNYNLRDFQSP